MMLSKKPVKQLDDLVGNKSFMFPDSMANDRVQDTLEKCIFLRINGENHRIFTGKKVQVTQQEFAVLRDSGMITSSYTYATRPEFDPIGRPYEI